jgi:hypothetical protein
MVVAFLSAFQKRMIIGIKFAGFQNQEIASCRFSKAFGATPEKFVIQ